MSDKQVMVPIKVQMRYFAQAADKAGCREEAVFLLADDQDTLKKQLISLHPSLELMLNNCRFAINGEFALAHDKLTEGAEIAVIPPVSGG